MPEAFLCNLAAVALKMTICEINYVVITQFNSVIIGAKVAINSNF